ncbi:MAG: hypothetical protein Q7T55_12600, partial [Solirubrobacteraceae bacterium]|nr:hypothetical protein [Solirubrobacteraceae bacterium]
MTSIDTTRTPPAALATSSGDRPAVAEASSALGPREIPRSIAILGELPAPLLLLVDVAAIVLDIRMPGVNGVELAQIIKGTKRFREVPILF